MLAPLRNLSTAASLVVTFCCAAVMVVASSRMVKVNVAISGLANTSPLPLTLIVLRLADSFPIYGARLNSLYVLTSMKSVKSTMKAITIFLTMSFFNISFIFFRYALIYFHSTIVHHKEYFQFLNSFHSQEI